jgi:hypothetical protein
MTTGSGAERTTKAFPMASVHGRDWGIGLFKLSGCEFCDDVMAECADIAIGDAWLPEFIEDYRGENIVVLRDPHIAGLVEAGAKSGALSVTPVTPEDAALSQSSGLRHRREGLAHRLARRQKAGLWSPRKRVAPNIAGDPKRQEIYDNRMEIAFRSNAAFFKARKAGDISLFEAEMQPFISRLITLGRGSLKTRAIGKLKRLARKVLPI